MREIYLAGPDVFYRNAEEHFEKLEARLAQVGLKGVRPADGNLAQWRHLPAAQQAQRIYRDNHALLLRCDAVLANLAPFRSTMEPDSGTVFEVGFAVALKKPVVGLLPDRSRLEDRIRLSCGRTLDERGLPFDDKYGLLIEEFGLPLNLMLACSVPLCTSVDEALDVLAERLRGDSSSLRAALSRSS